MLSSVMNRNSLGRLALRFKHSLFQSKQKHNQSFLIGEKFTALEHLHGLGLLSYLFEGSLN